MIFLILRLVLKEFNFYQFCTQSDLNYQVKAQSAFLSGLSSVF